MKLELELPEFKDSLDIHLTIKRDGELLVCSGSPSEVKTEISEEPKKKAAKTTKSSSGGNLMNMDF